MERSYGGKVLSVCTQWTFISNLFYELLNFSSEFCWFCDCFFSEHFTFCWGQKVIIREERGRNISWILPLLTNNTWSFCKWLINVFLGNLNCFERWIWRGNKIRTLMFPWFLYLIIFINCRHGIWEQQQKYFYLNLIVICFFLHFFINFWLYGFAPSNFFFYHFTTVI